VAKRRSLDDALTPEQVAFLKTGTPAKAKTTNAKPKPKPKKEAPTMNRPAVKMKEEFPPASSNAAPIAVAGNGAINARIDPKITTALLRASVERRIQGEAPATQRDIIAEALSAWLKKNGYAI
jgi:hypothetical protein